MKNPLALGALVTPLFIAQAALAQSQPTDSASAQAQPAQGLQEVIVTAERRTENIQNVPISITAFTGEQLKQLGMTEGFDLANQVPNMNIDKAFGDSNVRYFIRGVGTQDFSTLATSPVAVYVDDMYLGSTVGNSIDMFDMHRVEVLLGPQGTLWGRNTTGGAINFLSNLPTQTFSASASAGYGNHDARTVDSMVNLPITSTLAARVAIMYSGQGAWVKNLDPTGPHNLEAYNKVGSRLGLEWTPSDTFSAYLKGEYLKRTGSTITPHMVPIKGETDKFGDPALPIDEVDQGSGPSSDDFDTWDTMLRLDWKFSSFAKLVSITGFQNVERLHEWELDGGTPFMVFNGAFFGNHDQFTQEVRLISQNSGAFRWQGGVFYYFARDAAATASPFNEALFGAPAGDITNDLWAVREKSNSDAVFGGVEYDLTSNLTAKGGLRYNEDEGSFHADHYSIYPYANYLNYLSPNPLADPNSVLVPGDTINTSKDWSKLTWDAGLRYHFSETKMVYLNGSTGYRQGTFNTPTGATAKTFTVLQPESNLAFELGTKTSWLDHKLEVDAAAFDYNYKNMQVFALQPLVSVGGGGGLASIWSNAGKATDRGGEIEVKAVPAKGWLLTGDVGYVHAVFTQFNTFTSAGVPLSLAGNRFPRQPQWTASTLVHYEFQLPNGASVGLQTDWNYRGDYYVNPNNLANPYIAGRTIGNVSATYTPINGRFDVTLWAKNVTDKTYAMGGYNIAFANSRIFYDGDPLTYGFKVSVYF